MLTEERVRQIAYEVVEQELGQPGAGLAATWRVWEAIEALTIAQQRTEEEVRALAEAQRRTEERVGELAEAQRRTEERVARLEATVQELVEIVRRHEERLAAVEERLAAVEERLASAEERLARLEDIVAKLVEAQHHLEQRMEELAEAQRHLEQRMEELAEAQRRTEQQLQQLAEAHYRLEEVVTQLIRRVDQMSLQLGQLSNRLGLDLEVDAEEVLMSLLKERGIRPLQEPFAIEVDGEMDVVVPVELPTGERPWIIVEVKGRLRRKELGEFLQRLQRPWVQERLRQEGIQKPYLPYAFGLRVYADVDRMATEAGVGILTFRGERVAPQLWE
jgi:predicted  nucleic acid-binding Zn-ribbon protein